MIVGVGIDVVDVARFEQILDRRPALRIRLFTPAERGLAIASLAARFAAKEAVLKILELNEIVPRWKSIEVRRSVGGRPEVALHGEAAEIARSQGIIEISLSISHGGGIASATVIAQATRRPIGAFQ